MTIAEELRALAERIPVAGPPTVTLARQRGTGAAEAVTAALSTDPALAERQRRWLDVLAGLLRPLARQVAVAIESEQLAAAGASTAHGPCLPGPGSRQAREACRPDRQADG